MLSSVLSAVLVSFIAYSIRWRLRTLKLFRENNIPGPPPRFLWGNLWEIYRNGHLAMQKRWHEEYGPIIGYFYGLSPVVVVADTDLLKQVMLKDFHKFADRSDLVSGSVTGGFDDSLMTLKGQRWKDVRATLSPSFTSKKLKEITPVMCASVDGFMENVEKGFNHSAQCDFYESYQALTLDTICKAAMGIDYGIQKDFGNSKALRRVRAMLTIRVNFLHLIIVSFPMLVSLFGKVLTNLFFRLQNHLENPIEAFKKETAEVVRLRRSNPESVKRSDLLQLMMDAQDTGASTRNLTALIAGDTAEVIEAEKEAKTGRAITAASSGKEFLPVKKIRTLTESELVDSAFIVLLAGYETTASTLAFLTKMLVRFPEVQERVRAELMTATDGGKIFDFERLQSCQYTEAVLQETLRMYPPVMFLTARIASEDVNFGKMTIPRGVTVFASTNELQHRDDVFPEPYKFLPERFLPENRTPAMAASFVPFGAGPRNCIGMRFAQMEIKVTLAKLLTKYRVMSKNEPYHDPLIRTMQFPIVQQIRDPLKCDLELL